MESALRNKFVLWRWVVGLATLIGGLALLGIGIVMTIGLSDGGLEVLLAGIAAVVGGAIALLRPFVKACGVCNEPLQARALRFDSSLQEPLQQALKTGGVRALLSFGQAPLPSPTAPALASVVYCVCPRCSRAGLVYVAVERARQKNLITGVIESYYLDSRSPPVEVSGQDAADLCALGVARGQVSISL